MCSYLRFLVLVIFPFPFSRSTTGFVGFQSTTERRHFQPHHPPLFITHIIFIDSILNTSSPALIQLPFVLHTPRKSIPQWRAAVNHKNPVWLSTTPSPPCLPLPPVSETSWDISSPYQTPMRLLTTFPTCRLPSSSNAPQPLSQMRKQSTTSPPTARCFDGPTWN